MPGVKSTGGFPDLPIQDGSPVATPAGLGAGDGHWSRHDMHTAGGWRCWWGLCAPRARPVHSGFCSWRTRNVKDKTGAARAGRSQLDVPVDVLTLAGMEPAPEAECGMDGRGFSQLTPSISSQGLHRLRSQLGLSLTSRQGWRKLPEGGGGSSEAPSVSLGQTVEEAAAALLAPSLDVCAIF